MMILHFVGGIIIMMVIIIMHFTIFFSYTHMLQDKGSIKKTELKQMKVKA